MFSINKELLPYKYRKFTNTCIEAIALDANHPLCDLFRQAVTIKG